MKKIFNAIVSFVCCFMIFSSPITTILPVMAEGDGTTYINKEDVTERNVKVISNVAGDTSMILYEYQSVFYITMDTVKELTGLSTSVSTGNGIFSAAVTDGIRTVYVNLEDRTISDEINDKVVKDTSGEEIVNDINAMLYNNEFLVEAVPFLRYLGASVEYINGYFICLMNQNSIWSVLPDAVEDIDKFLIPFTSYIPDYKKRLTLDIIGDYISGGNLIISAENTMNNYYKEAIYDMFEVNPYSYDSVKNQEERNIQNEKPFFDSKQLLDLGDQLKDVGIDTAKILEDLYLTSEIDWLDFKWNGAYKLGFTEEASKISKELNMKTVKLYEDTVDGGNIDKAGYVVSALIYGAKIYSDYNKINNYDNDTAYCLAAEVDSMKYAYSDTSSIGWLQIADRVSKDVLDSRNNARDSILDNTIDLMQGEGNDLIVSAASGEALLVMKAATFLTNIICKDIIEAEHHEIITMLQQDMQYQSYNLCYELWKKAESENFSNAETVIRFVDALKFFYRFSMAYYNSIQQWGEHYYPNEDWKTPFQNRNDAMALKFYNLLNAKMMPNENLYNYEAWKDDEFSESAFQESTSEIIDISSYTGRYGKDNIYVEIAPVGDSEVNISVEFLTDSKSILSTISYNGTINKYMSFEACDRSSNNAYTIDLLEESIHLTVHRLKYINDMNPWDMPDTDIILPRLSDKTSNRDISDWTNDMIANAINHYLQYYYDDYYVDSSDIVEDLYSKYVYLKAKNGEATPPQTKYIARWNQQNDIWQFGIANSDVGVIFHLTDFDPNYTSPIKGTSTFNSTHEEIYYSYIENELIPKYGLCPSGEDIAYEDLVGKIVSAYIFEDKETKQHNLLTVRYPETLYESCILSLYSKNNDEIVLLDEYIINIFPTEFELGFNNGYVCYRAQAYSNSGISYDFDYYIFDVNNNHIKLLHHYRINGFFVEPYEISIYDEENKSINRQQIEQTIAEYGINYTINEDYYSINFENENGILDIHLFVPLCGLNDPSFSYKIKDYTNLVNHIHTTNKVGKVITEKDPLNVRQSPSTESEKIGTVDKGSTITILSEVNGWYEIEFNGKSGYVSGEFVQIVE